MSRKSEKRDYSIEFKIDAASLVDQGYIIKDACEPLGVPLSNMTRWLSQYRKGKLQPGYKQAQPTTNETEVRRLQSEVKRIEMEVVILIKASTYKSLQQGVASR